MRIRLYLLHQAGLMTASQHCPPGLRVTLCQLHQRSRLIPLREHRQSSKDLLMAPTRLRSPTMLLKVEKTGRPFWTSSWCPSWKTQTSRFFARTSTAAGGESHWACDTFLFSSRLTSSHFWWPSLGICGSIWLAWCASASVMLCVIRLANHFDFLIILSSSGEC
jgi:hypothetical protein